MRNVVGADCRRPNSGPARDAVFEGLRQAKVDDLHKFKQGKYFLLVTEVIADGEDMSNMLLERGLARVRAEGNEKTPSVPPHRLSACDSLLASHVGSRLLVRRSALRLDGLHNTNGLGVYLFRHSTTAIYRLRVRYFRNASGQWRAA